MSDQVNNPNHYNTHGIECIEAIEASLTPEEFRGHLKATTMKYLWRYAYKGKPLQDVEKAQWYLNLLVEKMEEKVFGPKGDSEL